MEWKPDISDLLHEAMNLKRFIRLHRMLLFTSFFFYYWFLFSGETLRLIGYPDYPEYIWLLAVVVLSMHSPPFLLPN
jgi:hypothetical protein